MRCRVPVRVLFAAASLALLNGCASPKPAAEREIPEEFPYHTLEQIQLHLREQQDLLTSFQAKASISVRTPERSGQFSADMHARKNDSLYLSISPGLGIEAARALVTPDSFYFYDRIKNRLVYGSLGEAAGFLPQPFTSENLFENILGLTAPTADTQWEVSTDSSYYVLTSEEGLRRYVVDPAFWRVVRYDEFSPSGTLVEQRRYTDFGEFGDTVLPRRVEFERPLQDQRASIYYRDIIIEPDHLTFALRTRDSTERVRAGD